MAPLGLVERQPMARQCMLLTWELYCVSRGLGHHAHEHARSHGQCAPVPCWLLGVQPWPTKTVTHAHPNTSRALLLLTGYQLFRRRRGLVLLLRPKGGQYRLEGCMMGLGSWNGRLERRPQPATKSCRCETWVERLPPSSARFFRPHLSCFLWLAPRAAYPHRHPPAADAKHTDGAHPEANLTGANPVLQLHRASKGCVLLCGSG